jgi:hypothetical protein
MIDIECREEALEYPMESFGEGSRSRLHNNQEGH